MPRAVILHTVESEALALMTWASVCSSLPELRGVPA